MEKTCVAFLMDDEKEALEHIKYQRPEIIKDYGDKAYGRLMYQGDDGWRKLCRCTKCGGLYILQYAEEHFMSRDDEWFYDYYPVSSQSEAENICKENDGNRLAGYFHDRYLRAFYENVPFWRLGYKLPKEEKETIKTKYNCHFTFD